MNNCISAELPIITVDICLNGITMSTDEYSLGHFSLSGSGEYDDESGFYYLRSRYYDPFVGRFLNADKVVFSGNCFDGFNMYAYCCNNPINFSDPSGESCICTQRRVNSRNHICQDEEEDTFWESFVKNTTGTYTLGQNVCASLGIVSVELQIMFSIDTKGNIALQWAYAGGFITSGDFTLSSQTFETVTTAPTVDYLEGNGYLLGGTKSFPITDTTLALLAGYGIDIIPDKDNPGRFF